MGHFSLLHGSCSLSPHCQQFPHGDPSGGLHRLAAASLTWVWMYLPGTRPPRLLYRSIRGRAEGELTALPTQLLPARISQPTA